VYPVQTRLFWYLNDEFVGSSIGKENISLLLLELRINQELGGGGNKRR